MCSVVSFEKVDAETLEHRGHRRIYILVGPSDMMTTRLEHSSERRHCGTADSY
jgi:hypothetical protein